MPEKTSNPIQIEISELNLPYAQFRIASPEAVRKLAASLEQRGQLTPVVVCIGKQGKSLLDGYRRVAALGQIGQDLVLAELWQCEEVEGLSRIIARNQARPWDPVEEALLIRELHEIHRLKQYEIGHLLGRTQSWVARRLSLVENLPEKILTKVIAGTVSAWAASRILAPMARAMPEHCRQLCDHLSQNPLSTRQLDEFWKHYQRASKSGRAKMVKEPDVFLKSLAARREEQKERELTDGPDGKWCKDIRIAKNIIARCRRGMIGVFHPDITRIEKRILLTSFNELREEYKKINDHVGTWEKQDDLAGTRRNDQNHEISGHSAPQDSKKPQDFPEHGKKCAEKQENAKVDSRAKPPVDPGTFQTLQGQRDTGTGSAQPGV